MIIYQSLLNYAEQHIETIPQLTYKPNISFKYNHENNTIYTQFFVK